MPAQSAQLFIGCQVPKPHVVISTACYQLFAAKGHAPDFLCVGAKAALQFAIVGIPDPYHAIVAAQRGTLTIGAECADVRPALLRSARHGPARAFAANRSGAVRGQWR